MSISLLADLETEHDSISLLGMLISYNGRAVHSTVGMKHALTPLDEVCLLSLTSYVTLAKLHKFSQAQTSQKGIVIPSSWKHRAD